MLLDLTEKIINAETVQTYEQAVKEMADYLPMPENPIKRRNLRRLQHFEITGFPDERQQETLLPEKRPLRNTADLCRSLKPPLPAQSRSYWRTFLFSAEICTRQGYTTVAASGSKNT